MNNISNTKLYIVSDHAGLELKTMVRKINPNIIDLSPINTPTDDYPDFAQLLADKLVNEPNSMGFAVCGSGQGICMSLNRFKWIRAGLVLQLKQVHNLREHNNANVLCLSQDFTNTDDLKQIIEEFVLTNVSNEVRHIRRIKKFS
jgi:ribose 5-phosphate isomerase B